MSDVPHIPPEQTSSGPGHETSDVGVALIVKFIIVFAVIIAVSMPLLWWLMNYFERRAESRDPELPPIADLQQQPPAPNLQASPAADYETFRDKQLARLQNSGWVDRQQKIVHIPIERAMELVLKEGLPKPKPDAQPGNDARPAAQTREPSVPADEDSRGQAPSNQDNQPAPQSDANSDTQNGDEIVP